VLIAWTRADFGKELSKVWEVELNAAPAVPLVVMHFRIRASLLGPNPNLKFRAFALAVSALALTGGFALEAATTFRGAAF
jgi:hypothetical protein